MVSAATSFRFASAAGVTLLASVLVASCSDQPSSAPSTQPVVRLSKTASFNGVAISVPDGFAISEFNGCLLEAHQVLVGPPRVGAGKCSYPVSSYSWGSSGGSADLTGAILSTAKYATAVNGSTWGSPRMVNGLIVQESPPVVDGCPGSGQCTLTSNLYVRIQSRNVGLEIEASGSPSETALALGRRMIATLRPVQ